MQQIEAEGGGGALALSRLRHDLQGAFGRTSRDGRPAMEILILGVAGAGERGGERAAEALKRGFRPWSKLLTTAPELVAAALRPVQPDLGRALARAEQLIGVMRRLAARSGGLSLDFLAEMRLQDASAWLEDALGLHPSLISAVLSASPILHRIVHPAPEALRVVRRLGLGAPAAGPVLSGRALADAAPADWNGIDLVELSGLLQTLGEAICRADQPDCASCPVAASCPSATAAPGAGQTVRPMVYLRRRIARMEGEGRSTPTAGLRLGGEAFGEGVFPHGLSFGVHQAAPATPMQGAAPLILAIAAAKAVERRERDGRSPEGPVGFLRRRAKPLARAAPTPAVRLLVVQEVDAVLEHGEPYPPGLQALGVDPATTAFVTVASGAEALRVVEEALKLRAAPILVVELRRGEVTLDLAVTRRLNLAARRAGAFLFLITPDLSNTSAALTRWRIGAAPSRPAAFSRRSRVGPPAFTLDLVRNRLGQTGAWTVEWDLHEQRFRTSASRILAPSALPAPHLPPPVDRPAVAHGRAA